MVLLVVYKKKEKLVLDLNSIESYVKVTSEVFPMQFDSSDMHLLVLCTPNVISFFVVGTVMYNHLIKVDQDLRMDRFT